ncbi:hypothetical protein BCE_A0003 (plasmid) [Bacillus cereus ATCC 10987]|uniref:Uncharacterized protein n=1 Tax=Bacillus cereus (strain ATCC 10987 / NRS 248) TaxID=222523 RepID=Q735K2_BACC1|nr:hypothetical protein BCE_3150 [Bacillus cereus ATCC 10987]AAS44853.1 hypothetical protein BCE_A0003 [Bacillus cereus ATCC 10987]
MTKTKFHQKTMIGTKHCKKYNIFVTVYVIQEI